MGLDIYDLFGKTVHSFEYPATSNGGRSGGNEITWDGKNSRGEPVAFGVYILRLRSKDTGHTITYKLGVVH
jgi:hypothetical protein